MFYILLRPVFWIRSKQLGMVYPVELRIHQIWSSNIPSFCDCEVPLFSEHLKLRFSYYAASFVIRISLPPLPKTGSQSIVCEFAGHASFHAMPFFGVGFDALDLNCISYRFKRTRHEQHCFGSALWSRSSTACANGREHRLCEASKHYFGTNKY